MCLGTTTQIPLAGLFLTFLIPAIVYHDKKVFSMNDAFYLIGSIFFLGISFAILIMNILTPYIMALTRKKPFGTKKAKKTKAGGEKK